MFRKPALVVWLYKYGDIDWIYRINTKIVIQDLRQYLKENLNILSPSCGLLEIQMG